MKKYIILTLILSPYLINGATEKFLTSEIKNVTVYTRGAQVFRTAEITLSRGSTDLIISDVPADIDISSIQAGGKGNFVLLNIKHRVKYLEPPKKTDSLLYFNGEIFELNDSLRELSFKMDELNEMQNAFYFEKQMILNNKLAAGEGKSDSLAVLKQAMIFFRDKLEEINTKIFSNKRKIQNNSALQAKIQIRLNDLNKYKSNISQEVKYEPTNQIVISVSADEQVNAVINLNYYVRSAGWIPSYDLRATNVNSPVQLTYKANIFQNTGEDWQNVKLKLATTNPAASNEMPVLPVWYIDFIKYEDLNVRGSRDDGTILLFDGMKVRGTPGISEVNAITSEAYTQTIEQIQNVTFDVNLAFTIPSDNENHVVPVESANLNSTFFYFLIPKIDNNAYVVAQLTGWEKLNLLPGKANVFYENTFIGSTNLNSREINDTLNLAFGRENNIICKRTKLNDKVTDSFWNNDAVQSVTYEIKIKNNKSDSLRLVIQDQIPVTKNNDIKIELKNKSKAEYTSDTGLLKWNFIMSPKSSKTLTFDYSVSYDKLKEVSLK